jgi:hypothetical protein
MTDWKPIENIPEFLKQDERRVQLWTKGPFYPDGEPITAYWDGDCWELGGNEFYESYDRGGFEQGVTFTHYAEITPPNTLTTPNTTA